MKRPVVVIAALGLLWAGCKCVAGEDDAKDSPNKQHQPGMANPGTAGTGSPNPTAPPQPAAKVANNNVAAKTSPTPPPDSENKSTTTTTTTDPPPAKTPAVANAVRAPQPKSGTKAAGNKPISAKAMAEAQQIYKQRCANCHGVKGRGDGPVARALKPRPRDYSNRKWQAKTSDKTIATAIVRGGPAVGLKPTMPPNSDLENKPEVVRALVHIIRSFVAPKKK